jgi:hypothetical protein
LPNTEKGDKGEKGEKRVKRERDRKALNTFNIDFANGDPDNLRDLFFPNHLLPFPLIYRSHRSGTPRTHCLRKSFVSVLLRLQSSEDKVGLLQGLRVGFMVGDAFSRRKYTPSHNLVILHHNKSELK